MMLPRVTYRTIGFCILLICSSQEIESASDESKSDSLKKDAQDTKYGTSSATSPRYSTSEIVQPAQIRNKRKSNLLNREVFNDDNVKLNSAFRYNDQIMQNLLKMQSPKQLNYARSNFFLNLLKPRTTRFHTWEDHSLMHFGKRSVDEDREKAIMKRSTDYLSPENTLQIESGTNSRVDQEIKPKILTLEFPDFGTEITNEFDNNEEEKHSLVENAAEETGYGNLEDEDIDKKSTDPWHNVMSFGKKSENPWDHSTLHFGKKSEPWHNVMSFGKRFDDQWDHNTLHFGKREDPWHNTMSFGKREDPWHNTMSFGKREDPWHNTMSFGKREDPWHNTMSFGKREDPWHNTMSFGKREDPWHNTMSFGKREDPWHNTMSFGKREDPWHNTMSFGKREDPWHNTMSFGKREDPWHNTMSFGKREDPWHNTMSFGKREDPWHNTMSFGKKSDPWHNMMSFGKKSDPWHNVMSFGKRSDNIWDHSTLHFGKRNDPWHNMMSFGKKSENPWDHSTLHFGKKAEPWHNMMSFGKKSETHENNMTDDKRNDPWHNVMSFGKKSDENFDDHFTLHFGKRGESWHNLMNFGKKSDNFGFDHNTLHFGKRDEPWHSMMSFGKRPYGMMYDDQGDFGSPWEDNSGMSFNKKSNPWDHNTLHFGKRLNENLDTNSPERDSLENANSKHINKRSVDDSDSHDSTHLGKESETDDVEKDVIEDKRSDWDMQNTLHFGKKRDPWEYQNTMHFGKRDPWDYQNTMHFGKRNPWNYHNIMYSDKRDPWDYHDTMHFGKRSPWEYQNTMHFGKRDPWQYQNTMHFGKRSDIVKSDKGKEINTSKLNNQSKDGDSSDENEEENSENKQTNEGKKTRQKDTHSRIKKRSVGNESKLKVEETSQNVDNTRNEIPEMVLHFGKRSIDDQRYSELSPFLDESWNNYNTMHFDKRDPWDHSTMHFGKRDPWDHNTMHFGKRDPWDHNTMHFGKRNPWDHNTMHFGKRDPWNHDTMHFGKKNEVEYKEIGENNNTPFEDYQSELNTLATNGIDNLLNDVAFQLNSRDKSIIEYLEEALQSRNVPSDIKLNYLKSYLKSILKKFLNKEDADTMSPFVQPEDFNLDSNEGDGERVLEEYENDVNHENSLLKAGMHDIYFGNKLQPMADDVDNGKYSNVGWALPWKGKTKRNFYAKSDLKRYFAPFQGPKSFLYPHALFASQIRRSAIPRTIDVSRGFEIRTAEKKEDPFNSYMHFGRR